MDVDAAPPSPASSDDVPDNVAPWLDACGEYAHRRQRQPTRAELEAEAALLVAEALARASCTTLATLPIPAAAHTYVTYALVSTPRAACVDALAACIVQTFAHKDAHRRSRRYIRRIVCNVQSGVVRGVAPHGRSGSDGGGGDGDDDAPLFYYFSWDATAACGRSAAVARARGGSGGDAEETA